MSRASSWFSGPSVECQLSNEMAKPSSVGLRVAAISAMNCCGVFPALSAAIMIGAPCASSAQTKCTWWPRMRWKRTQTSAWMYSIRWPTWNGAFAYGSAVVTKSLRGIARRRWQTFDFRDAPKDSEHLCGLALRESRRRCAPERPPQGETRNMVRRVRAAVVAAVAIGAALLVANFVLSVHHTRQLRDESAAVLA